MENATPLSTAGAMAAVKLEVLSEESQGLVPAASVSLADALVTTVAGTAPVLPATVVATYDTEKTDNVPVAWEAIPETAYAQPGEFEVKGAVEGTEIKAKAVVTVTAKPVIESVAAVSVSTEAGTAPTLPATVTATYSDQTTASVAVTWDEVPASAYAKPGTFEVSGAIADTDVKAKATVTVVGKNLIVNPSFEQNTAWTYATGASRGNESGNPRTGSYAVNYYQSGTPSGNGETYQTVTGIEPGIYSLSAWIHGQATGSGTLELFAEVDGKSYTASATLAGWQAWQNPVANDIVIEGGTARVGLRITYGDGTWAWFDDFSLLRTGDLPSTALDIPVVKYASGDILADSGQTSTAVSVDVFVEVLPEQQYFYSISDTQTEVIAHYEGTPDQPVGSYVDGPLPDGIPVPQDGKITVPAPTASNPVVLKVATQKGSAVSPAFTHTFVFEGLSLRISTDVEGKVTAIFDNFTKEKVDVILSLAAYSDEVLADIASKTVSAEPNSSTSIDLPASPTNTYKAFAWDGNFAPITEAVSYKYTD
jgi:hypothetical protein